MAYTAVRCVDQARDTSRLKGFHEEEEWGMSQSSALIAKSEGSSRGVKKDSGDRQCGVLEHGFRPPSPMRPFRSRTPHLAVSHPRIHISESTCSRLVHDLRPYNFLESRRRAEAVFEIISSWRSCCNVARARARLRSTAPV